MSDRPGKFLGAARRLDDFIIDRLLQPGINVADWHLGLNLHKLARLSAVLGAAVGLLWVHAFDAPFSADFWQDLLCLLIMTGAAWMQIRTTEATHPRRPALAPAVRLTGLFWRTLWLADLALLPAQIPLESWAELLGNVLWTVLLVLPYWIICCRTAPPPERRMAGAFRYATIPVR